MPTLKPLLTADEAAELLTRAGYPVSTETIRRWSRQGRLPVIRAPGLRRAQKRFRREDIEALLVPQVETEVAS